MEIGIFFFVTLTIYINVHQELPFTGRWKFVYYNDFFLHISSVTSFLCYNSSTDDCRYKVLLGLQNHRLHRDASKIFLQVKTESTKKDVSGTDNV